MTDTPHLEALAMRTKAARTAEYLRDVSGRNQDGDFYVGEEAACFAGSVANEIVSEILALPLEADPAALVAEALRLPEVRALVEAIEQIRDRHIPDQPAAYGGDEVEWATRQHTELRRIARTALAALEQKP